MSGPYTDSWLNQIPSSEHSQTVEILELDLDCAAWVFNIKGNVFINSLQVEFDLSGSSLNQQHLHIAQLITSAERWCVTQDNVNKHAFQNFNQLQKPGKVGLYVEI